MAVDSPGFSSIVNTTIAEYMRDAEINILRNRILLAMMESKGRITFNHSGLKFNWRVRYKRSGMTPYASDQPISFARVDRYKTAELPNDRGYVTSEMMSEIDTLQNAGNEAIINLWNDKMTNMEEDIRENFCDELYKDGNATGNGSRIHGIESFLGAAATALAAGYVKPTDTYADLVTTPGNYGGSWSNGTYPLGSGDPQYDFWSPILVDYTSPVTGAYTSATRTWPNTCTEAMRNVITSTRKQKSRDGMIDLLMLEELLFKQYKNAQESFKQIPVLSGDALGMRALGFDVMSFDGLTISTEFGMPASTGYAFNTMKMELKSLRKQLFEPIGPVHNEEDLSYRWVIRTTGNLICNPKFFGKLYAYGQA